MTCVCSSNVMVDIERGRHHSRLIISGISFVLLSGEEGM